MFVFSPAQYRDIHAATAASVAPAEMGRHRRNSRMYTWREHEPFGVVAEAYGTAALRARVVGHRAVTNTSPVPVQSASERAYTAATSGSRACASSHLCYTSATATMLFSGKKSDDVCSRGYCIRAEELLPASVRSGDRPSPHCNRVLYGVWDGPSGPNKTKTLIWRDQERRPSSVL